MKPFIIDCHTHFESIAGAEHYFSLNPNSFVLTMRSAIFTAEHRDWFLELDRQLISKFPNIATIEAIDVSANIPQQLKTIKTDMEERKIVAIKIFLGYQSVYANDAALEPVYKFAAENNLSIIYHTGVLGKSYKNALYKYTTVLPIDEVAAKYPTVNFLASHFDFPKMLDAAGVITKNDNVFTDFSGVLEGDSGPDIINQLTADLRTVRNYYSDIYKYMVFATDYHGPDKLLSEVSAYIDIIRKIFPPAEQSAIFHENALRVFPRLKHFCRY